MQVIAVLNQKGGSGKTTIATHLARALQLDGHDVLLVDSDPQGSARHIPPDLVVARLRGIPIATRGHDLQIEHPV